MEYQLDAQETGEDLDRKRNWEYTIEEDEAWNKRMEKKKRNADYEFHGKVYRPLLGLAPTSPSIDQASTTHRKYKKDLDLLKPDLIAYNLQKERALNLEPGTLVTQDESGRFSLTAAANDESIMASGWYP